MDAKEVLKKAFVDRLKFEENDFTLEAALSHALPEEINVDDPEKFAEEVIGDLTLDFPNEILDMGDESPRNYWKAWGIQHMKDTLKKAVDSNLQE